MIPIQALLSRLRWDSRFAQGRWEIAYLDRTQPGLVRLPLEEVRPRAAGVAQREGRVVAIGHAARWEGAEAPACEAAAGAGAAHAAVRLADMT